MPYGRLYDDLHKHKKTRRSLTGGDRPRDASTMGLWVLANSWCIENYESDGWIPAWELESWDSDAAALAVRLVDADYWTPETVDGEAGFRFTDWLDRQKSAEQINAEREAARDRMKRVRANGKRKTPARSPQVHDSDTDVDTKKTPAADAADFDAFWELYPRKIGKTAARKAYAKARKEVTAERIAEGVTNAAAVWFASNTEERFIPHPTTWLNRGGWDDEQETIPSTQALERVTLAQCPDAQPHDRHRWEDARNKFMCSGVEPW